jgi:membrane fusion protein (multidrug efflux system)
VALLLAACGPGGQGAAPPPAALPVALLQVAIQRVPVLIEAVGQTEGSREVEIRARVSGIVQKRLYQEGDTVRADAQLFQIDRVPFEIALAQAKAALDQERAKNEQSRRESGRLKQLAAEKAISQKEYDDATSTLKQSDATLMSAEAKVREAELNLSYTAVSAPIGGVTGRAQRSEGSLVTAGTDSALLTTISQTDPIWVRFSFSEQEYAQLRGAPKKVEVRLVRPDQSVLAGNGRLNFTASTVDARLGTVQLRAEFANPGLALLPGQFVRAQVLAGERDAFLVPQTAVLQNDQGRFVWVAGAEGKAVAKPVETANWSGKDWVILKGLAGGDKVIVDNLLRIRPGMPVQARPPATPDTKAGPGGAPAAPVAAKAG